MGFNLIPMRSTKPARSLEVIMGWFWKSKSEESYKELCARLQREQDTKEQIKKQKELEQAALTRDELPRALEKIHKIEFDWRFSIFGKGMTEWDFTGRSQDNTRVVIKATIEEAVIMIFQQGITVFSRGHTNSIKRVGEPESWQLLYNYAKRIYEIELKKAGQREAEIKNQFWNS
jgi:hypothetical protein